MPNGFSIRDFAKGPRRSQQTAVMVAVRELVQDSGVFLRANDRPLKPRDFLRDAAIENLRQSAGINRGVESIRKSGLGVELPLQSSIADADDKTPEIQAALSTSSPVLSGRLAASWLNGESQVINNGDGTYTLDSRVPYARINDLGGDTGVNGKTHISPSYYVASAEAAVGLDPGSLQWVDGVLSGASGVGVRGVDRPAAFSLLSVNVGQREAA